MTKFLKLIFSILLVYKIDIFCEDRNIVDPYFVESINYFGENSLDPLALSEFRGNMSDKIKNSSEKEIVFFVDLVSLLAAIDSDMSDFDGDHFIRNVGNSSIILDKNSDKILDQDLNKKLQDTSSWFYKARLSVSSLHDGYSMEREAFKAAKKDKATILTLCERLKAKIDKNKIKLFIPDLFSKELGETQLFKSDDYFSIPYHAASIVYDELARKKKQ